MTRLAAVTADVQFRFSVAIMPTSFALRPHIHGTAGDAELHFAGYECFVAVFQLDAETDAVAHAVAAPKAADAVFRHPQRLAYA